VDQYFLSPQFCDDAQVVYVAKFDNIQNMNVENLNPPYILQAIEVIYF
jgi:hypothetical protein